MFAVKLICTAIAVIAWAALPGCGGQAVSNGARISAQIADAPSCPDPPPGFSASAARRWLGQCKQVATVAADHVARGIAEAERVRDIIWKQCLTDKRAAILSLRQRIAAERIALSGLFGERAVARIRRHCLRVQLLVAEAQSCV